MRHNNRKILIINTQIIHSWNGLQAFLPYSFPLKDFCHFSQLNANKILNDESSRCKCQNPVTFAHQNNKSWMDLFLSRFVLKIIHVQDPDPVWT